MTLQVLRSRPAFIRWLRKLQLWDVLYGPHFFFLRGHPGTSAHRSISAVDPSGGLPLPHHPAFSFR